MAVSYLLTAFFISTHSHEHCYYRCIERFWKGIAEKFASEGHDLYICSRNAVALYKTVDEILTSIPGDNNQIKAFRP